MSSNTTEYVELSDDDDVEYCQQEFPSGGSKVAPVSCLSATNMSGNGNRGLRDGIPCVARFGDLHLDRKKMEADRLARLGTKRRRSNGMAPDSPPRKLKAKGAVSHVSACHLTTSPSRQGNRPLNLPFGSGSVRRTWALGHTRCGNDIMIEEVFQKGELELAVLASYQWDEEWLLSKINLAKTKLLCIAYAYNDAQKEQMRANVSSRQIRFCFPPVSGGGKMHAKIQLLKFPGYLRIVLPSGNLTPYDWGETGVMENMVFLIDLPLKGVDNLGLGSTATDFGIELRRFLVALGLEDQLVASLDKYDFTVTQRYAFIHSICGTHQEQDSQFTGYRGLARAIRNLGLATDNAIEVDFVCSSVGNLKPELLLALYRAFQGHDSSDQQGGQLRGKKRELFSLQSDTSFDRTPLDSFRFYYPSQETVATSCGGPSSAGTICFQSSWWNSPSFPRKSWRDGVCRRQGLLIHTKAAFARSRHTDGLSRAWAYIGSANLSESAWGRLDMDRRSGNLKMTCRNWECGIVLKSRESVTSDLEALFDGVVPIPMEIPGATFNSKLPSSRLPWFGKQS